MKKKKRKIGGGGRYWNCDFEMFTSSTYSYTITQRRTASRHSSSNPGGEIKFVTVVGNCVATTNTRICHSDQFQLRVVLIVNCVNKKWRICIEHKICDILKNKEPFLFSGEDGEGKYEPILHGCRLGVIPSHLVVTYNNVTLHVSSSWDFFISFPFADLFFFKILLLLYF